MSSDNKWYWISTAQQWAFCNITATNSPFVTAIRTAQHTADDYFLDMEGNPYYPGEG